MKTKETLILTLFLSMMLITGCTSLSTSDLHLLESKLPYTKTDNGLLYEAPGSDIDSLDAVVFSPVKVHTTIKRENTKCYTLAREFASDLDSALTSSIPAETPLSVLRPGENIPLTAKVADLEIAVTELDPGSGFARWFFGAGAGATKVQVEGRLTQPPNDLVMAFAYRRAHSGNPTLGINVAALSDDYTLKELRKQFTKDITKLLTSQ